jgi:dihydrodipicolinate synthase/N-acetylneuraminate lyase
MERMAHRKNLNAQALGRLGGKARAEKLSDAEVVEIASKGGKARAAMLSADERKRIAKHAVAARERKRKENR